MFGWDITRRGRESTVSGCALFRIIKEWYGNKCDFGALKHIYINCQLFVYESNRLETQKAKQQGNYIKYAVLY